MSEIPPQIPAHLPPMTPPPPSYLPPAPKQTNVAAIISLITGILSCIPGMSIFAVILGVVGLVKSGKPNVGGKGLAITGLILGIIGLAWTGGVVLVAIRGKAMLAQTAPSRAIAKQFVLDVSKGDEKAAMSDCSPSISEAKVQSAIQDAQAWGALQDTTFFSININNPNGAATTTVGGAAVFANTKKSFTATVDHEDGVYRITDFNFVDGR